MDYDYEIDQLEKYLLSEDQEEFIKRLIPDTEIYYYFKLLHILEEKGGQLSQTQQQALKKLKQLKTAKSKNIALRHLIKSYDKCQTEEQRAKILRKLNKKLFKLKFLDKKEDKNNLGKNNARLNSGSSSSNSQIEIRRGPRRENVPQRGSVSEYSDEELDDPRSDFSGNDELSANNNLDPSPQIQQQQQQQQFQVEQIMDLQIPAVQIQEVKGEGFDSDDSEKDEKQGDEKKHPLVSDLDPSYLDIDRQLKKIYKTPSTFSNLMLDEFLLLNLEKFIENIKEAKDTSVIKDFLTQVDLPNLKREELYLLVSHYIKLNRGKNKNYVFDLNVIYRFLTKEQFIFLAEQEPQLIGGTKEYIGELFVKEFAQNTVDLRASKPSSEAERKQHLQNLLRKYQWGLSHQIEASKNFTSQLLFEYLNYSALINQPDFNLFKQYLKDPRENIQNESERLKNYRQQKQHQEQQLFYQKNKNSNVASGLFSQNNKNRVVQIKTDDTYWYNIHGYQTANWNQNELIKTFIESYFITNQSTDTKAFQETFDEKYLQKILVTIRLQLGQMDLSSNISEFINPAEIQELQTSQKLKICDWNQSLFMRDDQVQVTLQIKNIPNLTVKIFQIVTQNYFRKNLSQFNENIDLDGLTANEEQVYNLSSELTHPCKSVLKEFKFQSLSKISQGLFIVEFFGSGMASRLIVRKGKLIPILRYGANGHSIRFIDQRGVLVVANQKENGNKVGIWVDDVFYSAAQGEAEINIPFQKNNSTKNYVAVNGSFAQLITLDLRMEDYSFSAKYLYNRETFLMGNRARIIIQPVLNLNGQSVSVELIKEQKIVVTTTTDDNIPAVTQIENPHFSNSNDVLIEFPIPAQILRAQIRVTGQVRKQTLTDGAGSSPIQIQVAHEHTINFDTYQNSQVFVSLFLFRSQVGGYSVKVLGQNGEPKANLQVDFTLGSSVLRNPFTVTLISNGNGIINLGKCPRIIYIQAKLKGTPDIQSIQKKWLIDETMSWVKNYTDQDLFLVEGQVLRVVANSIKNKSEIDRKNLLFVRTRPSPNLLQSNPNSEQELGVIENCLNLLRQEDGGYLVAEKLPAGEYILRVKEEKMNYRIKVLKQAQRWVQLYSKRETDLEMNESIITEKNFFDMKEKYARAQQPFRKATASFNEKQEFEVKIEGIKKTEWKNLRVHLLGFHTYPRVYVNPGDTYNLSFPRKVVDRINLTDYSNKFLSNRTLGDEFSYVLDRKGQTRFTGNSLQRPSILVKRNFVRDTVQQAADLRLDYSYCEEAGANFDDQDYFGGEQHRFSQAPVRQMDYMYKAKEMKSMPQRQIAVQSYGMTSHSMPQANEQIFYFQNKKLGVELGTENVDSFLNFLQNPSVILANLQVDPDTGIVKVPNFSLGGLSVLQVAICTTFHTSLLTVPIPTPGPLETRDLAQKNNLARDQFYSIFRNSTIVPKGKSFSIADITSTEYAIIDSIQGLMDLQVDLAKYNMTYNSYTETWGFLQQWFDFSEEEKLLKYNQYMSHELNFFLYQKDRQFFDEVVVALINNKIEKSFVDLFLLGRDDEIVKLFSSIERLQQISIFQKILLFIVFTRKNMVSELENSISQLENLFQTQPIDKQHEKKLFDLVLNREDKSKTVTTSTSSLKRNNYNQSRKAYDSDCSNSIGSRDSLSNCSDDDQEDTPDEDNSSDSGSRPNSGIYQPRIARNNQRARRHSGIAISRKQQCEEMEFDDDMGLFGEQCQEERKPTMSQKKKAVQNNNLFYDSMANNNNNNKMINAQQQRLTAQSSQGQKTKEYCERHFYEQIQENYSNNVFNVNSFWLELAKYIASSVTTSSDTSSSSSNYQKGEGQGFFSPAVLFSTSSNSEMIITLAFSDLPTTPLPPVQKQGQSGKEMIIQANGNFLIFMKEIRQGTPKLRSDLLIAQRFYDPKNQYEYSEEDPNIYFQKDATEFLINQVYGCQVIITNCNVSQQQMQILTEVPQGSIPVNNIEYTKSQNMVLKAYTTSIVEFFFYFPSPGQFSIYPANVSKQGFVYAVAKEQIFEVLAERVITKLETLDQILSKGGNQDILTFIETKNIFNNKIFQFSDIYHLLTDQAFFLQLLDILRRRRVFQYHIWSYSIYHADHKSFVEFMNSKVNREKFDQYINYIKTSVVSIEKSFGLNGGLTMKLLEYYPLINSRVHLLRQDCANILNNEFQRHYLHFMRYLAEKGMKNLDFFDQISLIYYLLLQERVEEALQIFEKIGDQQILTAQGGIIQYDYIQAYLDFYSGAPELKVARSTIEKYLDFPGIAWRNRFFEMANQIADFDGEDVLSDPLVDKLSSDEKQKALKLKESQREKLLEIQIENKKIVIQHQNIVSTLVKKSGESTAKPTIELQFFIIDLQVFFSQNPFLAQISQDFGFLQPSYTQNVVVEDVSPGTLASSAFDIPEKLQTVNVFIQASTPFQKAGTTYFSTSLQVQVFEQSGQLQVTDQANQPLSQIYIKSFSQQNNGTISFHQDGYTDLRGRFDFVTLSGEVDQDIQKFGIFAMSDSLGSLILQSKAPQSLSNDQNVIQLISQKWESLRNERTTLNKSQQ